MGLINAGMHQLPGSSKNQHNIKENQNKTIWIVWKLIVYGPLINFMANVMCRLIKKLYSVAWIKIFSYVKSVGDFMSYRYYCQQ